MEVPQAEASRFSGEIIGYQDHENPWDALQKAFGQRGVHNSVQAALETNYVPYRIVENLRSIINIVSINPVESYIEQLRMLKDESEIAHMKKAAELADYAINVGVENIRKGRTEQAIIAEIEYELAKMGYPETAFTTMVLSGEKSALPHGNPGDRQIQEGDFILFDLGFVANGYCSDISRTVAYKHVSDQQRDIYYKVLEAEEQALNACQPGTPLGELDRTAREVIESAGYGEYFPHRVGHGLGMEAHEAPSLSGDNHDPLQEGMVITIEPGIYVPDIGGVRIEDDVYISKDGPVVLTGYDKSLIIVE